MDPHLWELLEEGDPDDEVSAVLRLHRADAVPARVRLVSQFAEIATCRLRRRDIPAVRRDERVASLKAPDAVIPEDQIAAVPSPRLAETAMAASDERRPRALTPTGRGVVVGFVDWGADPSHPNFRHADGRTRLLALWDQRRRPGQRSPSRYGYGEVFSADTINRALDRTDPYEALGYHPRDADPGGSGSHGSHVMDIAGGNGRTGPVGLAPDSNLVFVHLGTTGTGGLATLGDSVALLEAVDFIARIAGDRPWVINLSIGNHGGPHDGSTPVEQGFDRVLLAAPGRAIVQSCGNYFERNTHAFGRLRPGEVKVLNWETDAGDITANELEVWYSGRDRLVVEVDAPGGARAPRVALGESAPLMHDGRRIGRVYHRAFDPNNGDHHINIFLYPGGPAGQWRVTLIGEDVVDGRYHGWIERDEGCRRCQSRFQGIDAAPFATTGTICNGLRTIAVGAYDGHSPDLEPASFSSMGPTRDGRQKPDLCAPGVDVLAARSASGDRQDDRTTLTRKSGTSMAAPHVTGCIALMFEAAPRLLAIDETRRLLLSAASPVNGPTAIGTRVGSGYLAVSAAVQAAGEVDGRPARRLDSTPREGRSEATADELDRADRATLAQRRRGPSALRARVGEERLMEAPESWESNTDKTASSAGGPIGVSARLPAFDAADVVAWPGESLHVVLRPGDLLVELRGARTSQVSVLASGEVLTAAELLRRGFGGGASPGRYVLIEGGPPRRIADEAGSLSGDVAILRPRRAQSEAFGEGAIDSTTRLRLSLWATESIVPLRPSGRVDRAGRPIAWPMDLRDRAAQDILRERLRKADSHLDDITLTRTIFLNDGTKAGGPVVWDASFLPGIPDAAARQAQLGALVDVCHREGIQVLAGYGEVTEGKGHTRAGDEFVRLVSAGDAAIDRHVEAITRFLFQDPATRVPFDGISLDLEINGLGVGHKPGLRRFMSKLAEALRGDGRFVALAAPPMVSASSTTLSGAPLSGWMQSQTLDAAQGVANLVARPMVYDGPTPDAAYHTAIIDFALRSSGDRRGGAGLSEAQLQIGVKVTKNKVIRGPRGEIVRGEWDGILRDAEAIRQRAVAVMRPKGVGLVFWHLKTDVAAHMEEIARIGAGLNPRPPAPRAGVSFQPRQAPRRPRIRAAL